MVEVGMPFPNFSLPNQDGELVRLNDFTGKWLVVYVYPKDDTPGCTIQGKSFTATRADFQAQHLAKPSRGARLIRIGCRTRLYAIWILRWRCRS